MDKAGSPGYFGAMALIVPGIFEAHEHPPLKVTSHEERFHNANVTWKTLASSIHN